MNIEKLALQHNEESRAYLNQLEATYGTSFEQLTQAEKLCLLDCIVADLYWNATQKRCEPIRSEIKEDVAYALRWLSVQLQFELMAKLTRGIYQTIEIETKIKEMHKRFQSIEITAAFTCFLFTILPPLALWIPALMLLALICNTCYVSGIISGLESSQDHE